MNAHANIRFSNYHDRHKYAPKRKRDLYAPDWERDLNGEQTAQPFLHVANSNRVLERADDSNFVLERTSKLLGQVSLGENFLSQSSSNLEQVSAERVTSGRLANLDDLEEEVGNVIRFSAPRHHPERPQISIVAVQEWEGVISEIFEDHFAATMVDVSADAHRPTEKMEIPLTLVDEDERDLLKPGVIFRLVIGRERRNGGQIQNKTLIYIRRNKFRLPERDRPGFGDLMQGWN